MADSVLFPLQNLGYVSVYCRLKSYTVHSVKQFVHRLLELLTDFRSIDRSVGFGSVIVPCLAVSLLDFVP